MKPRNKGVRRLIAATGHSIDGLRATWRYERGFRQELLLTAILLPCSFWLARSALEWIVLVAPVLIMLVVEVLNSAVECLVDRIGEEPHELSGRAKDMGSAAVLLSLIFLAAVWGAVGWDRFHG